MDIKLAIKKWLGTWWGHWCPFCGKPTEEVGYNGNSRCSDRSCLSRLDPRRFDIPPSLIKPKRRSRPRKQQSQP